MFIKQLFPEKSHQAMLVTVQGDVTGSLAGRIFGRSLPKVHSCPLRSVVTWTAPVTQGTTPR